METIGRVRGLSPKGDRTTPSLVHQSRWWLISDGFSSVVHQSEKKDMQSLCGGPYPSIEQQARRLQSEPGMPEWSLAVYASWCEGVNAVLVLILIESFRRSLAKRLGTDPDATSL
jgi:hypothetical protein